MVVAVAVAAAVAVVAATVVVEVGEEPEQTREVMPGTALVEL